MKRTYNFCSGPSHLDESIYQQLSKAVLDYNDTGMSLLEHFHRTPEIEAIVKEAEDLVRELMGLNADKHVLFLANGASLHFAMIPLNFLNSRAAYMQTGIWSDNAIAEAKKVGNVDVVASSADAGFSYIPNWPALTDSYDYLHFTSNNTDVGTWLRSLPDTDIPLIADMSSDLFSRNMDFNKFDLIYAGAQKNAGIAGCSLVIISDRLKERIKPGLLSILDYGVHAKHHSMFNTPPVMAIYASLLNLRWIKENGGIASMERLTEEKAGLLYAEIERNPMFIPFAKKESRSNTNVTFTAVDKETEEAFLRYAFEKDILNIAGYRKVGGFRVSLYNGISLEMVQYLVEVMKAFVE